MTVWLRRTLFVLVALHSALLVRSEGRVTADSLKALEAAENCRLFQSAARRSQKSRSAAEQAQAGQMRALDAARAALQRCAEANGLQASKSDLDEIALATACGDAYSEWVRIGMRSQVFDVEQAEAGQASEQLETLTRGMCPLASATR